MVELSLGSKLAAKVLGCIGGWTANGFGYFDHIHNDGFDTIAFAFDFGSNAWHLIPIEYIGDITIHIY